MESTMWQAYMAYNGSHPLIAAFVQFMVLGTLGELLSRRIRASRSGDAMPSMGPVKLTLKALGWALLGVYIKFMFLITTAGVAAMVEHAYLPESTRAGSLSYAFVVSAVMNIFLGPSMMIAHRVWDNGVDKLLAQKTPSFAGLHGSLWTLVWLWIPLHTITFTQPVELRIGIAAFLSLLLGIVMGFFAPVTREA